MSYRAGLASAIIQFCFTKSPKTDVREYPTLQQSQHSSMDGRMRPDTWLKALAPSKVVNVWYTTFINPRGTRSFLSKEPLLCTYALEPRTHAYHTYIHMNVLCSMLVTQHMHAMMWYVLLPYSHVQTLWCDFLIFGLVCCETGYVQEKRTRSEIVIAQSKGHQGWLVLR